MWNNSETDSDVPEFNNYRKKQYFGFMVIGFRKAIPKADQWKKKTGIAWNVSAPIRGKGVRLESGSKQNQSFYYWESIVQLQKAALCAMVVFFPESRIGMQVPTALLIMLIFTYLAIVNQPYQSKFLNWYNSLGMITCTLYLLIRLCIRAIPDDKNVLEVGTALSTQLNVVDLNATYTQMDRIENYSKIMVAFLVYVYFQFFYKFYYLALVSVSKPKNQDSILIRVLTFGCCSNKQLREIVDQQDEAEDEDYIDSDFEERVINRGIEKLKTPILEMANILKDPTTDKSIG